MATTASGGARRGGLWIAAAVGVLVVGVAVLAGAVGDGSGPRQGAGTEGERAVSTTGEPGPPGTGTPGGLAGVPVVERPARPEGTPAITVAPPSPPAGVEIPSLGVSSGLQRLGLDSSGELEVPTDFDVAGWFAAGPEPGQPGPAVVAGHVDSEDGPAVFYRLSELSPGDEVVVRREDGSTVRFTVTSVQRHPKDAFPTESVYGPVPGPELRLITCGGPFDTSADSYRDNVVVYAVAA